MRKSEANRLAADNTGISLMPLVFFFLIFAATVASLSHTLVSDTRLLITGYAAAIISLTLTPLLFYAFAIITINIIIRDIIIVTPWLLRYVTLLILLMMLI